MSLLSLPRRRRTAPGRIGPPEADHTTEPPLTKRHPDQEPCTPIGDVRWRERAHVAGRVRSVRVQPWADVPTLECTLVDETGGLTIVFLGRRDVAGIHPGTLMSVEGVAGAHHGKLAMLNAKYTLDGPAGPDHRPPPHQRPLILVHDPATKRDRVRRLTRPALQLRGSGA